MNPVKKIVLKSVKNESYSLLVDKVKIDIEQSYIISRLKNNNYENFKFNTEDNLWYFHNYKSIQRLIDLFFTDIKIKTITFKNNDVNDYRIDNINFILDEKYSNSFIDPPNCTILQRGEATYIKDGSCAGEYRNMYWKVSNDDDNSTCYIMHIIDDIYTKISKRDIKKVLFFKDKRPTWRLFQNGYVCCTINIDHKPKVYYLHQLIMNVHDENLTNFEKTVDHINRDKLDNRQVNLRLVNMSIQNSNRDKSERRSDACELPDGLVQTDLPKYVVYRKEILDSETMRSREYFYICSHPELDKNWETTKSNKISIRSKLKLAKLKLLELENKITDTKSETIINSKPDTNSYTKIDLPTHIRLVEERDKLHLVYDYKALDNRYSYKMILKSIDIQKELDIFIDNINEKYPEIKFDKYKIKSKNKISEKDISPIITNDKIKLDLPVNFSFFKEKESYFLSFNKTLNKNRITLKSLIRTNDIQNELTNFIKLVNEKYPQLLLPNHILTTIPTIPIIPMVSEQPTIQLVQQKPIMPANFSICSINSIDHIQFCKKINEKKYQYKTKINSYDLNLVLSNFINYLNSTYNLNLNNLDYTINNEVGWKTTNTII